MGEGEGEGRHSSHHLATISKTLGGVFCLNGWTLSRHTRCEKENDKHYSLNAIIFQPSLYSKYVNLPLNFYRINMSLQINGGSI